MHLVERERELAALSELLDDCIRGSGGATLVSGGIGCGKTALLTELGREAVERGYQVLGAVSSLAEKRSPGGVLGQLLRYANLQEEEHRLLAGLERPTTPSTGADPGPAALDPRTALVLQGLCVAVERLAKRGPVLLCVDDVQFSDLLSVHWLLLVLRRLPTAPIALAMTECTLSRPADPRLHAELLRRPGYRPLSLNRLSREGVTAVLAQRFTPALARTLAGECHTVSGGNPLLVLALSEDNAGRIAASCSRLAVGDAYLDAATGCLHRGWPTLLRIARALAVLDAVRDEEDDELEPEVRARSLTHHPGAVRPDYRLVAELAEVEEPVVVRGARALESAGLLRGGRPPHPAARAAALGSVTGEKRSTLHGRAAELLYEEGAPVTTIARHLLAAGPLRLPWALQLLRQAAERHLAASRPAAAQSCLEAALQVCDDDVERLRLKALLAGTAWVLDPSVGARHLVELATALRDGRLPDRYALMLAKYLLWHGRYDEAAGAIDRIGTSDDVSDPMAAAEARATRELLSATYPSLMPRSGRPASALRERGAVPGDPRSRGTAALSRVLRQGPSQEAVVSAEAAMRAMRLGRNTHEWLTCAVSALLFADRITAAADWCDHWLVEARSRKVPLWTAEFSSLRAGIALRQGDPRQAVELSEAALGQVPAESWGVCIGGPLANLIQAHTDTGDHAAAAAYLDVPVPEGMLHSRFNLYYLHARGSHHLATGQPHAALDDFTTCGELMRRWGFDQPALVPWRSGAARARLALGSTMVAFDLAQEQLALAGGEQSRTRGMTLRVLAAASRPSKRMALLKNAVVILEACGDRLQLAGALAELGTAAQRSGRPAKALAALNRSLRLAEECGAAALADEVRATLKPSEPAWEGRPTATGSTAPERMYDVLSAAEQRVAGFAARGHTNRQIAERLGITVSTVEQHLTRIFRKLGVRTRSALPADGALEAVAD